MVQQLSSLAGLAQAVRTGTDRHAWVSKNADGVAASVLACVSATPWACWEWSWVAWWPLHIFTDACMCGCWIKAIYFTIAITSQSVWQLHMEHSRVSVGTSAVASSFNSSCTAEDSGHETLEGGKEEEEGVRYTVGNAAVAWPVCCLILHRLSGGHSPAASSGERSHQALSWAVEAVFILQTWDVSFTQILYSTAFKVPAFQWLLHRPGVKNSVLSKTVHFSNSNTEAGDILNIKIVVKQDALFCRLKG